MPRVLRRGHTLRGQLTEEQEWSLILGAGGFFPDAFESDEERRRAWREHGHKLSVNECTRPQAFWDYDAPEKRNRNESSLQQLERLNLLRDDEIALLAKWRAKDPNYGRPRGNSVSNGSEQKQLEASNVQKTI